MSDQPVSRNHRILLLLSQGLLFLLFVVFSWGPITQLSRGVQQFDLRISDFLLPVIVALYCLLWLLDRRFPLTPARLREYPLVIILLLFAVMVLLSVFVAQEPITALRRAVRVWLLLLLAVGMLDYAPTLIRLRAALAIQVIFQGLVGLEQALLQHDLGLSILGEQPLQPELGFHVIETAERIVVRAQGLTVFPNSFAIALVVPRLICLGAYARSRSAQRLVWLFMFAIGGIALLFTYSWLVILAGVVALLYFALLGGWRAQAGKGNLIGLAVMSGLILLAFFVFNRDVITAQFNAVSGERAVQEAVGWQMVRSAPVLGVGANNSQLLFDSFLEQEFEGSRIIPNALLLISAETGVVNGILWFLVLITPVIFGIVRHKRLTVSTLSLAAALVPYLILDTRLAASWNSPSGMLLHWMLLALWMRAMAQPQIEPVEAADEAEQDADL